MGKNHYNISSLIIFTLILFCSNEILSDPQSGDLVLRIQEEINAIETRVAQTESGRRNITEQMSDIDREIELRRRLVAELNQRSITHSKRAKNINANIQIISSELEQLSAELTVQENKLIELRQVSGRRMNFMYRRLTAAKLTLLFSANNLNDLSQRQHYLKAIEQHDKYQLQKLREQTINVKVKRDQVKITQGNLQIDKSKHVSELKSVQTLIQMRKREETELKTERSLKYQLLDKVSKDAELYKALLDERKNSLEDIGKEINRLEGYRPTVNSKFTASVPFTTLKGKLRWPLNNRRIRHPFGNIRHPKFGTTVFNPGIDLVADPGETVFAVANGQVVRIAWLRGFGNTVILSHGDGYYTVYARLGSIRISENDIVNVGNQIGVVSDTGIEGGFHFEIWAQRDKKNPKNWLIQ